MTGFMQRLCFMVTCITTVGCQDSKYNPTNSSITDTGSDSSDNIPDPLGGCVYTGTNGEVPDNLYQRTQIVQSEAYPPFTKTLTVNGITLLGRDENADSFMELVATSIQELFPTDGAEIIPALQEQVIRSMYEHRTAIPLLKGDDSINFSNNEWLEFEQMAENNSLCDVIFEFGGQGQTMEVMEHVLHHVTMVGLHYTFYEQWGVSRESLQYELMQDAIVNGHYNQNYADEIDEADEALRVTLQEYAYWVITSDWDVQTQYGPNEFEWTLSTPENLQYAQPEMTVLLNSTTSKVLEVPSQSTLAAFQDQSIVGDDETGH